MGEHEGDKTADDLVEALQNEHRAEDGEERTLPRTLDEAVSPHDDRSNGDGSN